jgi:signal transduction histidine kinase
MATLNQGRGVTETSTDTYKQIMVAVVHASAVGLGELLKNYKGQAERTELIRTYANNIRFFPDQTGYFFVYDYDCLNIALPNPLDWQGKNLRDLQDLHGKYQIRELSEAAKKGGGFVEYYWLKPGSTEHHKKLSYAEPIPGTNYFIGTGAYISS